MRERAAKERANLFEECQRNCHGITVAEEGRGLIERSTFTPPLGMSGQPDPYGILRGGLGLL